MIVHPLESAGMRKRSLRGALPSVVVHAVIVLAVVHATAHAALPAAPPTVTGPIVYVPPKASEKPRTSAPRTHSLTHRSGEIGPIVDARPFVPPTIIADHVSSIPVGIVSPTIDRREFGDGIARGPVGAGGSAATGAPMTGLEVDRQVEPLPGAPAPEYPDALRSAGVRGSVLAEFVVDTTGRMEPGSFRTLRSDDPLFSAATRAALLRTRFRPAESNGRRVRQLVQQSFSFVLR